MKKNEIYTVKIEGYTHQGLGVARLPEGVVFVHQALMGESCEIQLLKVGKNESFARVRRVIEASAERVTPDCPVYGKCGGCALRHMSYAEECRMKARRVQDALRRIGGIDLPVEIVGARDLGGYRNKVIYPVALLDGQPTRGYFRARSHTLIPVERCALVPECADTLADVVIDWMRRCGVSAYDEGTLQGLVRNVFLRVTSLGEVMVCLVVNGDKIPHGEELIQALRAAEPKLASIVQCIHKRPGNAVLSDRFITLWGADRLNETLCGLRFTLSPRSFFQVNHDQAERLYRCAVEAAQLTGTERVLDLYCGTGTITLAMARHAREAIGVEVIPSAVEDAKENAAANGLGNTRFFCADAGQAAAQLAAEGLAPDVIVVDPPRKGLSLDAMEAMVQMAPARIVYVSCDPATLARDAKLLQQHGYRAEYAQALDLFPRCAHVETVCLLSKLQAKQHIEINLDMDELDLTDAEKKATYQEIKDYVLEHSGLKVSSLYIAQIKQKCGIIERENYNKPKSEDAKQPGCPPDKEKAIKEALRHFGMI